MGMTVTGAREVSAGFLKQIETVRVGGPALVLHFGQLYQARVKARASGRPGPNVITGAYRDSIRMEVVSMGTLSAVAVGTDSPQGYRLENGFYGTDSLGRNYHQPAYPHWEPDLLRTAEELASAASQLAGGGAGVGVDSSGISAVSFS